MGNESMGKLLIIADEKGKGYATPRGLQLAAKLGLDAEVVAFTYASFKHLKVSDQEGARIRQQLVEDRREEVQARIDKHCREEQRVRLKVVWEKDIIGWVNRQCARTDYAYVVKTGRRSENLVHTSTDWQLLRECPAPVMIVSDKKWHRTQPVLAALDLSTNLRAKKQLNHTILAHAKNLAEVLGVDLHIISAIEIPTLLADLDLVDTHAYVREARESMAPNIRSLSKTHDLPASAFDTKRGPVEKVIASRAASVRAQVVVMGTVGRKGVRARLLGNTADEVLRHLKTDVIALKP
jgi:universal stress protein E